MRSASLSQGHRDDKELISMFDKKLIEIMSINSSYPIEFSTVKQLIYKLSSNTLKERLRSGLEDVKIMDKDLYSTNNYLQTLSHLLNIAKLQVDEELDTRALESSSYSEPGK